MRYCERRPLVFFIRFHHNHHSWPFLCAAFPANSHKYAAESQKGQVAPIMLGMALFRSPSLFLVRNDELGRYAGTMSRTQFCCTSRSDMVTPIASRFRNLLLRTRECLVKWFKDYRGVTCRSRKQALRSREEGRTGINKQSGCTI